MKTFLAVIHVIVFLVTGMAGGLAMAHEHVNENPVVIHGHESGWTRLLNIAAPAINVSGPTGNISACVGSPSASPNILQFTVSGSGLTSDITVTAPADFEVSLTASTGYSKSTIIPASGGAVPATVIYVRSAASASAGNLSGNISLASGSAMNSVAVTGAVHALPTVDPVADQTVVNGANTTAVHFTGTGNTFTWTNDNTSIGLPASGDGDIASFAAVNTGSSPVTAHISATPASQGYAYIVDYPNGSLMVFNTVTNVLEKTIPIAQYLGSAIVSPDGSRVYITSTNYSNNNGGTVFVISTATNSVISKITVGNRPGGISLNPDGSRLFVSDGIAGTVAVVNTITNTTVATITIGPNSSPTNSVVSTDGKTLYMLNGNYNSVGLSISVIDLAIYSVTKTVYLGAAPAGISIQPRGIVLSPDGSRIYVANDAINTVTVFNTASNTVIDDISVGDTPSGLAISPDGRALYLTDSYNDHVKVIDLPTRNITSSLDMGYNKDPYGIAITGDGSLIYVLKSDSYVVISTSTKQVVSETAIYNGYQSAVFGNFLKSGSGCTGAPVNFDITVTPTPAPTITATGNIPNFFTTYGTPTGSAGFFLNGTNLISDVVITPPTGFEISIDNKTFTPTITLTPAKANSGVLFFYRLAATTPVGEYPGDIVISSGNISNSTLTITKAMVSPANLVISADKQTKTYGTPNPTFTVTYQGFQNSDGPAQLLQQPQISTNALTNSPAGQYNIVVTGASSPNYSISYVNSTLTILPVATPPPVTPPAGPLIIPNTFTPNGDGINDTWNINLDSYPNALVHVYNRWGEAVYSSTGKLAWDGKYNGKDLPAAVYYYVIDTGNGAAPVSGYVMIIR